MNSAQFYQKIEIFEKIGEITGIFLGKIIKNPIRFLGIVISFMFVGLIAFFCSFNNGIKKS